MPYETTWEPQGVSQKFRGVVSSPELLDALADIQNDSRVRTLRYLLRDFLDVDVFDVGLKVLLEGRVWSAAIRDRIPDIVIAVVTTSPEIIRSMQTASSYGLNAHPFAIFPNVDAARAWIAGFGDGRSA